MLRPPLSTTLFPYTTLFRSESHAAVENRRGVLRLLLERYPGDHLINGGRAQPRPEEHTSELQSRGPLVCSPLPEHRKLQIASLPPRAPIYRGYALHGCHRRE